MATIVGKGLRPVSLDDKYLVEDGEVYLTGIQALARLPMDQARRDRRAGLHTGVLITGYEGSPLGGYDLTLARLRHLLAPLHIVHIPALNEEVAATAIMGSQMLHHFPKPKVDGVVGIWYGKSPGVDRCGDVFRHGNMGGGGKLSGAIMLGGDDPAAKSSTAPNFSEYAFLNAGMPVIYPGTVADFLELGLHAIALSRFTGLWVGFKVTTNLADGGSTVRVSPDHPTITIPELTIDRQPFQKADNFMFLPPIVVDMEYHIYHRAHVAAQAYARANGLDRIVVAGPYDRIGIVAAGKSFADTRQALLDMGLGDETLRELGIRLLKIGMMYPLDPVIIQRFAEGLEQIIVVEEKRDFLESQIRSILYSLPRRPVVVGKRDEQGNVLFPMYGELDADMVTERLAPRLLPLEPPESVSRRLEQIQIIRRRPYEIFPIRKPNYCSGCPHNRSTIIVEGEVVGGGIGCHGGMGGIQTQPWRQIAYLTPMGGEGAPWIGASPFSDLSHFFQNVGDGTFFHSASQSLRAAVASGANITFKILYNRTVAMTGGQDIVGTRDVPALTRLLEAEGVKRTIVVAEDPKRYPRSEPFAKNAKVYDRERYTEAVKELKQVPGVTALIYDQMCANEKRRLRKRGRLPEPNRFVVINEDVCEGCGHCGEVSNCMSVQPVDTEFGRKTRVHLSSCNKDYLCLEGDCPSFLLVETKKGTGLAKKRPPSLDLEELAEPTHKAELQGSYHIYIPGIGGTGVVTVNALLCHAAWMEGKQVLNLDQTGLAQKGGAVLSSLVLSENPVQTDASNRVGMGKADLLLVLDSLGGVTPVNLDRASPDRTVAVVDIALTPTGEMVRHVDATAPDSDDLREAIEQYTKADRNVYVDANRISEGLFGDHMVTNLFTLGVAYQVGLIPLQVESIEAAIRLNGVAVEENTQAFRYGRLYVQDPQRVEALLAPRQRTPEEEREEALRQLGHTSREGQAYLALLDRCSTLDEEARRMLAIRIAELIQYQDAAYAQQYVEKVLEVASREQAVLPGRHGLTHAAIRYLYKLMAYKDEYEVARLHLKGYWQQHIREQFEAPRKVKFALHPPFLRALGYQRKVYFGPWFRHVFRVLRAMRRLRGTRWDLFGRTKVRREERQLVQWYRNLLDQVLAHVTPERYDLAVEIAEAPDRIRGYEEIKMRNTQQTYAWVEERMGQLTAAAQVPTTR